MDSANKHTILLVDDDRDFREILRIKLESKGFSIEEATNGEEGYEKAKKIRPDLVVMDVQMPKMNGVESLTKIKGDKDISGLRVIFVTNFGESDPNSNDLDDKFAKGAGAVGHVRKTDDLDRIATRITEELTIASGN